MNRFLRVVQQRRLLPAALLMCWALSATVFADDWPQWRGPQRDGNWNEAGVPVTFKSEKLKPKWSQPIGAGYSGPTVADGRVFVTDRVDSPKQIERVHCFAEADGKKLWSHSYDCEYVGIGYTAGPRACVTISGDLAFALGAMGDLHCLKAETGEVVWHKDLNNDYAISANRRMPIWGIAAAPLIYEDLVILHLGGSTGACIVAFNRSTGKEVWRALDDRASYTAPIVIQQNGQDVLICWTGDSLSGLHPKTGEVAWRNAFPPSKMPIGIATPLHQQNRIFVTSFYDGSLMLKLGENDLTAERDWRRKGRSEMATDALHSIISTPIWLDDHIYGVDSYGELRCLNAATGDRVWEDLTATPKARWSNIHFVQNGETTWMFNERGELITGKLSPKGFEEIDRTKIIEPTMEQLRRRGGVCWAHPAFANRCVLIRNDEKIVSVSLE